jgi:transcriptional regulator with XRE-family HTH domain
MDLLEHYQVVDSSVKRRILRAENDAEGTVHVAEGEKARHRTLADKLDHLYRTIHPAGRGEYSNEEVATAIRERGGSTISATYLWQLRKGMRDNPAIKHVEALADFFGVSPSYFFDDAAAERIDTELRLLIALRDGPVRHLALRAHGLSHESLAKIAEMVEWVRDLEGLPDERTRAGEDSGPSRQRPPESTA